MEQGMEEMGQQGETFLEKDRKLINGVVYPAIFTYSFWKQVN